MAYRKTDEELEHQPPPVDRSKTAQTGNTVPTRGMQSSYTILDDEERARGFVRTLRHSYLHIACEKITTMGRSIAETYARDPSFYSGTYCSNCGNHFPVGEDGEFIWVNGDGKREWRGIGNNAPGSGPWKVGT